MRLYENHSRLFVQICCAGLAAVLCAVGMSLLRPVQAHAAALQIRPLMYQETLQPQTTKKGYVDVSNAGSSRVVVGLHVRGFRQTDDKGTLQFYESQTIAGGIRLDLKEVELEPRESVRMYFVIDGKRLPKGDVFAAIFAATQSERSVGITPSAQVGTLLIVQNGPAPARTATLENLQAPTLQIGKAVQGTVTIRNPAPAESVSGFFPRASISLQPFGGKTSDITGPLVMAGRARQVSFSVPDSRIGLYRLTVTSGSSSTSTWLVAITGDWRWIVLAGAGACIAIIVIIITLKRRVRPGVPPAAPPASNARSAGL